MTEKTDNPDAIRVAHVGKRLGKVPILRDVSLNVAYGDIVGIIGSNGSGKTLLLRLLCGLAYPTTGTIMIDRHVLRPGLWGTMAHNVGVLIETPGFLPSLSAMDNLHILAMIKNRITRHRIADVLQQVGLRSEDPRPVRLYSLGMRQRLGIAQALMEDPSVLLLDEPTNGLDPEFRQEFLAMLEDLARSGKAIVLTSHELHEVEQVATQIYALRDGHLTATQQ